ncbi:MAG: glucose-1-phosphate adenylyltransferase [Oscillospiraceae bacterium]|nr:glucose-1-phosphate adenylyltransferase [Oscillospiraceae bacterium]
MRKEKCIAMLLAGGQGSRLGALTKRIAKPAVSFGSKYRIIDFSLSNCANSHINAVGVLTQYKPLILNAYIGTGAAWDLDEPGAGVTVLPPFATESGGEWYKGTADAIFQNIDYIAGYDPKYVLIISGDHLYRMDYNAMLERHIDKGADLTISVLHVPMDEASRFGIMTADESGRITKFAEKPKRPESDLASMGIYMFSWPVLRKALTEDAANEASDHDFGKNVIPKLLGENKRLYTYEFSGYWKDVGTIESYYSTSMELLDPKPGFDLFSDRNPILSNSNTQPPQFIGPDGAISECLVGNGCVVLGKASHSILSTETSVGAGAVVTDSILLPGATVEAGAHVHKAIVGERAVVRSGVTLGKADLSGNIIVIADQKAVTKDQI